jgi:DNA-directed RNA polymerase specialized sigma24 family protein
MVRFSTPNSRPLPYRSSHQFMKYPRTTAYLRSLRTGPIRFAREPGDLDQGEKDRLADKVMADMPRILQWVKNRKPAYAREDLDLESIADLALAKALHVFRQGGTASFTTFFIRSLLGKAKDAMRALRRRPTTSFTDLGEGEENSFHSGQLEAGRELPEEEAALAEDRRTPVNEFLGKVTHPNAKKLALEQAREAAEAVPELGLDPAEYAPKKAYVQSQSAAQKKAQARYAEKKRQERQAQKAAVPPVDPAEKAAKQRAAKAAKAKRYRERQKAKKTPPPIAEPPAQPPEHLARHNHLKYAAGAVSPPTPAAPSQPVAPAAPSQPPRAAGPGPHQPAPLPTAPQAGLPFEDAAQQAGSGNQAAFRKIMGEMLKNAGLKGQTYDAIGDTKEFGTEPSLLQAIDQTDDPGKIDYLASWYGLLANQKSVLVFHPGHGGKDSFYTVTVPATDLNQLRKVLDQYGLDYRTLVPKKGTIEVAIYDPDRVNRDKVAQFTGAVSGRIQESVGSGHLLGDSADNPDSAKARSAYRAVIDQYEAGKDPEPATPAGGVQAGQGPLRNRRRPGPQSARWTFQGLRAPAPFRFGKSKIPQGTFLSRYWFERAIGRRETQGPVRLARPVVGPEENIPTHEEHQAIEGLREWRHFPRSTPQDVDIYLPYQPSQTKTGWVWKHGQPTKVRPEGNIPLYSRGNDLHDKPVDPALIKKHLQGPQKLAKKSEPVETNPLTGERADEPSDFELQHGRRATTADAEKTPKYKSPKPSRRKPKPKLKPRPQIEQGGLGNNSSVPYSPDDQIETHPLMYRWNIVTAYPTSLLSQLRSWAYRRKDAVGRLSRSLLQEPDAATAQILNDAIEDVRTSNPLDVHKAAEFRTMLSSLADYLTNHTHPWGPEDTNPIRHARINAPAGGVVVRGVQYQGGKYIPSAEVEKAGYPAYQQIMSQGGGLRRPQKYRRPDGSFDRAFLPSPNDPIQKAQIEEVLNTEDMEAESEDLARV